MVISSLVCFLFQAPVQAIAPPVLTALTALVDIPHTWHGRARRTEGSVGVQPAAGCAAFHSSALGEFAAISLWSLLHSRCLSVLPRWKGMEFHWFTLPQSNTLHCHCAGNFKGPVLGTPKSKVKYFRGARKQQEVTKSLWLIQFNRIWNWLNNTVK